MVIVLKKKKFLHTYSFLFRKYQKEFMTNYGIPHTELSKRITVGCLVNTRLPIRVLIRIRQSFHKGKVNPVNHTNIPIITRELRLNLFPEKFTTKKKKKKGEIQIGHFFFPIVLR